MRKAIIAVCCLAFVGGLSASSAQTTGQPSQDSMKTSNPMDAQARMKKHKMRHHMMKKQMGMKKDDGMMGGGMGMKKDDGMMGMKKDDGMMGMKKDPNMK